MGKDFSKYLKERILIADGAIGTMLQNRVIKEGESNEECNLSHPEVVCEIHRQYIEAGADIILTNTFGGNPLKLKASGLDKKAEEINIAAVYLVKKAIEINPTKREIFIAGNIGPAGEFLKPLGAFSEKDFYNNFSDQAEALVKGGIDLIVLETMTSIEEARIALNAAKHSGVPVIVSMSFNRDKDGNFHTMMGVSIEDFIKMATKLKADGVGTNCGGISVEMDDVILRLRKLTPLPILAEPNAGQPRLIDGKTLYDLSPEKIVDLAIRLKKAGANIIGGCCGTTPGHIQAIAEAIK